MISWQAFEERRKIECIQYELETIRCSQDRLNSEKEKCEHSLSSLDGNTPSVPFQVYSLTHLLTHLLTYSLTHLLTHSLTHTLTHLLTHALTYSLTHSHTHSLTYLLTYLLIHTLTHLLTHSLTHSLTHLLTYSHTHLFTHTLTHAHTHSLTHSLTHSPTHSLTHSHTRSHTHTLIFLNSLLITIFYMDYITHGIPMLSLICITVLHFVIIVKYKYIFSYHPKLLLQLT